MIKIILSAIILLILPIQAWSETLTIDDLVRKDDFLYYKKSTNIHLQERFQVKKVESQKMVRRMVNG